MGLLLLFAIVGIIDIIVLVFLVRVVFRILKKLLGKNKYTQEEWKNIQEQNRHQSVYNYSPDWKWDETKREWVHKSQWK